MGLRWLFVRSAIEVVIVLAVGAIAWAWIGIWGFIVVCGVAGVAWVMQGRLILRRERRKPGHADS